MEINLNTGSSKLHLRISEMTQSECLMPWNWIQINWNVFLLKTKPSFWGELGCSQKVWGLIPASSVTFKQGTISKHVLLLKYSN